MTIAILVAISSCLPSLAIPNIDSGLNNRLYIELASLESEKLIEEAKPDISGDTLTERALMALTIVTNRYYENPADSGTRHNAVTAFNALAYNYQSKLIDFKKAYQNLMSAVQIAEKDKDFKQLAWIYLAIANLFQNSDINPQTTPKTEEYLIKALDAAIASKSTPLACSSAFAMAVSAFNKEGWGEFAASVSRFKDYMENSNFKQPLYYFATASIEACDAFLNKEFGKAKSLLSAAKKHADLKTLFGISKNMDLDALIAIVALKEDDPATSISLYKNILSLAHANDLSMYEMTAAKELYGLYRGKEMNDSSDYYYGKYLRLKDNLENNNSFRGVEKLEFLSDLDKINDEVKLLSLKRQEERRLRMLVISILAIVLIVLLAIIVLYLNLKRNHRNLFKRNEEMLRLSEQHKLMREQWEEERKELIRSQESRNDTGVKDTDAENNKDNPDPKKEVDETESEISDIEELKRIYARVLAVMENAPNIFLPGFSLHDLQKLVKVRARNLSKAINICHHNNFHQLLSEYRIREVTRIMHTREAAQMTVEAIAESAGFKSRTSFSTLFKKSTGLTPSEYMKMAQAKNLEEAR